MSYDTVNLRYEADFETLIYRNLYWVPVNRLGKTRYSVRDLEGIAGLPPEEKREAINTLYEAVQLFQIGDFKVVIDVKYVEENGYNWGHNKPGYYAVLTNSGCCAAAATWLSYILDKKYEEIGIVYIFNSLGNGHSVNYIKYEGGTYIIDMYALANKHVHLASIETGKKEDFRKAKANTGIFIKTDSFESFANFYAKFEYLRAPEHLFILHRKTLECAPAAIKKTDDQRVEVVLPDNIEAISFINQDRKNSIIECKFDTPPLYSPDWNELSCPSNALRM